MEKRRVKLDICGISCSLITEESEEYMISLQTELSQTMGQILSAMPINNVQLAALTTALSYLDEKNKANAKIEILKEEIKELKIALENRLQEKIVIKNEKKEVPQGKLINPMRHYFDDKDLVSFYEKEDASSDDMESIDE